MRRKNHKKSRHSERGYNSQRSHNSPPRQAFKSGSHHRKILDGIVKRHPDGFGFFVADDPNQVDIYIPKPEMAGVMTNDRVRIEVHPEPGGTRFRGKIVEVLSRAVKRVMGQYISRSQNTGLLQDKSFGWGEDLFVEKGPEQMVKHGDWVSVEIDSYPGTQKGFAGHVVAIIGDGLDPQNDSLRVLYSSQIPYGFSKATLAEVEKIPEQVLESEMRGRKDLRNVKLVTIDGKTAKDFDDAIYVEKDRDGFRLWVAIADVSHYVKPGTAVDQDAYLRGTSTYFPNFVAPMLPEKLSNNLCSLNPHVPRLSLVAEMRFNFSGEMTEARFYEAVIQSHARVTYGEAQEILDGHKIQSLQHVHAEIVQAADLAKILMAKRFREGSLDLDLPETVIELDGTGQPVDIIKSARLFSHRLIEELMLAANVAVAKEFTKHGISSLYRIHDPPRMEDIAVLQRFMAAFGSQTSLSGGLLQKKLTKTLQEFVNHPKAHVMNVLTLRSMAQAKYSPANVGHFGLGFSDYAHFTSPIRRYPDLIVHRTLKALLKIPGYQLMSQSELETAGTMLSACEQRSVKAERQIQGIKKARFMKTLLGQEFEGVISSVTKFGIFVALRQFDVDGLIHVEELFQEPFEYDPQQLRLVAKRSGLAYSIGDPVTVQVAAVDIEGGQIDFVLAGSEPQAKVGKSDHQRHRPKKAQAQKPAQGRRPAEDHRRGVRKARVSKSGGKGQARSVSRRKAHHNSSR